MIAVLPVLGMLAYILYAVRVLRPETWGLLPEAAWISSAALVGLVVLGGLLALVVVLSALASFFPARNASRLTVREVLAYE